MKKQTAVEWLVSALVKHDRTFREFYGAEIEQAKALEKEQIIEAFKHGELPPLFVNYDAEQYYKETYGK